MNYHKNPDFIGPYWDEAAAYNFVMQFVGEIDHTQPGTDYQLRMLGRKCVYFSTRTDQYAKAFNQYMERNIPEIERCFSKYTLRVLDGWDWDIIKHLALYGVKIPDNFLRSAMIRRKLTLPYPLSTDCS